MKPEKKTLLCLLLCLSLLCAALSGCGSETTPAETPAPTQAATATPAPTPTPEPTPEPAPEPTPEVTPAPEPEIDPETIPGLGGRTAATGTDLNPWEVRVDSVETLLDSIFPYAELVLAPGDYDLTLEMDDEALAEFNRTHGCVRLEKCFDGIEIVIHDCDGLTIRGDDVGSAEVRLTTQPRYATVLSFVNCSGLLVSHLTMGHTPERGSCEGDVVRLTGCSNVLLDNADLYGCGVYGVNAKECGGSVYVRNCILRECEYGPFSIEDCPCDFFFVGCALVDSDGGGVWLLDEEEPEASLRFINCEFGQNETNIWKFNDDAQFDGCVFGIVTQYPDIASEA